MSFSGSEKQSVSRSADLAMAVIAIAITAAAYMRSLSNGFVFDDRALIYGNRYIGQWSFIWKSFVNDVWWFADPSHPPQSSYYRPLEDLWLAINYHLFGLNPVGWHASMIAVQLVAVWLVFKLTRELTHNLIAAFLAALLFGLIPVHAGTISWARSIPLPASSIFQIAALLCFMRRAAALRRNLAASLVLFAAALLSHESPVVFPVIVAAYVFLLEAPDEERLLPNLDVTLERVKRSAIEAAPFAAVVIVYLALRLCVLGAIAPVNPRNDWTPIERILTVPEALGEFLLLLALPWRAGPGHEMRPVASVLSPGFYLPVLGLVAAGAGLWLLFRHHTHRRLYLFCAVWALIWLAPVLNLRTLNPVETIHDRFLFMPSVAWCIFLSDFAAGFVAEGGLEARGALAAAAVVAVAYAGLLWRAQHYWHDDVTYYRRCIQNNPVSWVCHANLGVDLMQVGDYKDAEHEFESARQVRPHDGAIIGDLASLHVKMNKLNQAKEEFEHELAIWKDAPVAAYVALSEVSAQLGDRKTSDQMLEHAASMPGGKLTAQRARAKIKIHVDHDYAGAEKELEQIPVADRDVEIWTLLGSVAARQAKFEDALADYSSAIKLDPDNSELSLRHAAMLSRLGRFDDALTEVNLALTAHPDDRGLRALAKRLERRSASQ